MRAALGDAARSGPGGPVCAMPGSLPRPCPTAPRRRDRRGAPARPDRPRQPERPGGMAPGRRSSRRPRGRGRPAADRPRGFPRRGTPRRHRAPNSRMVPPRRRAVEPGWAVARAPSRGPGRERHQQALPVVVVGALQGPHGQMVGVRVGVVGPVLDARGARACRGGRTGRTGVALTGAAGMAAARPDGDRDVVAMSSRSSTRVGTGGDQRASPGCERALVGRRARACGAAWGSAAPSARDEVARQARRRAAPRATSRSSATSPQRAAVSDRCLASLHGAGR